MPSLFLRRTLAALLLACFATPATLHAAVPLNELTDSEQRSGWELLFDGKATDQWRNFKKDSVSDKWVIEDSILTLSGRGGGDIITREQYDSFELQLEFRISKGGNSGIMFHVTEEEQTSYMTGPEIQLQDNVDGHDPQKAGWLYQLYKPMKPAWAKRFEAQVGFKGIEMDDATRPAGEWNHVYLRLHPKQSEVQVNGVHYYYFVKGSDDWNTRVANSKFSKMAKFGKADKGHICLQDHGNVISFRNLKIRKLTADGKAPNPVDATLPLKAELAFPALTFEGWQPVSDAGLPQPLRPIELIHGNDGTNRLFVATQGGRVWVFPNDPATKQATLFLDIRKRVHQWKKDDEEGVLGFAIHPKFKETGEVFVYYNNEDKARGVHLSRFTVSKDDANRADPASEEVLLSFEQPFSNHNGGPMAFGPDGYLYIGMGDGGGRNDPTGQGQAKDSFMGTILRIDVDHKDAGKAYAVPKDNPFVGTEGVPGEIFATGIRNTWRLSFDPKTGSCWMADVGQDWLEEVNIIVKGGNYGWSAREGTHAFGNAKTPKDLKVIDPVWEYDHRIGKSITGGYVYRGSRLPELEGHYLYGDYITGLLWGLQYDEKAGKVVRNVAIPWKGQNIIAFGQDEKGEVYLMTPTVNGKFIYRFSREQ